MRSSLFAALVLVSSFPLPALAQPACAEPTFATLWPSVTQREGVVVDGTHERTRVLAVELDGAPPAEAVLTVDSLVSELESELGEPSTAIYVLRCAASADGASARWTPLGRVDLPIDTGWEGTLDVAPGVVVLRAETMPGVGHDFARIEQVDVRGSYDPRFVARRLAYVHVVDGNVVVAFRATVRVETESGPDRAEGPTTIRSVVVRPTRPSSIRFTVRETNERGRTRTLCRTILAFDGETFVPEDDACDAYGSDDE